MTLAELIAAYRTEAHDKAEPFFASDEEVTGWLNEGVKEAAIRGRLIHENDDPAICQIDVVPGASSYPLHPSIYELTHIAYLKDGESRRRPLCLTSTELMDAEVPGWRDAEGDPVYAIQGDKGIRLAPRPLAAGKVMIEGYRVPVEPMIDPGDEPEINQIHHQHITQWAVYRASVMIDADIFDPERAARAESEFTRYFGRRTDADLRRMTREDVPQVTRPFWP